MAIGGVNNGNAQALQNLDSTRGSTSASEAGQLIETKGTTFESSSGAVKGSPLSAGQKNNFSSLAARRPSIGGNTLSQANVPNSAGVDKNQPVSVNGKEISFGEFRQLLLSFDQPLTGDLFTDKGMATPELQETVADVVNLFRENPLQFVAVLEERFYDPDTGVSNKTLDALLPEGEMSMDMMKELAQSTTERKAGSFEHSVEVIKEVLEDRGTESLNRLELKQQTESTKSGTVDAANKYSKKADTGHDSKLKPGVAENIGNGFTALEIVEDFIKDFGSYQNDRGETVSNDEEKGHLKNLLKNGSSIGVGVYNQASKKEKNDETPVVRNDTNSVIRIK